MCSEVYCWRQERLGGSSVIDIMSTLRMGNRSFICTKCSVSIYTSMKKETYFSSSGLFFHDPFGFPLNSSATLMWWAPQAGRLWENTILARLKAPEGTHLTLFLFVSPAPVWFSLKEHSQSNQKQCTNIRVYPRYFSHTIKDIQVFSSTSSKSCFLLLSAALSTPWGMTPPLFHSSPRKRSSSHHPH